MDAIVETCRQCGEPLKEPRQLKGFCSYAHRGQYAAGQLHQTGLVGSKNIKQRRELRTLKRQGGGRLTSAKVNPCTIRIDGPQKKGLAWVIDVGINKPAWIARYKDQTTNPMPLKEATAAAIAMAKGDCGDYVIRDPIAHLNGLAARLTDRCGKPGSSSRLSL